MLTSSTVLVHVTGIGISENRAGRQRERKPNIKPLTNPSGEHGTYNMQVETTQLWHNFHPQYTYAFAQ